MRPLRLLPCVLVVLTVVACSAAPEKKKKAIAPRDPGAAYEDDDGTIPPEEPSDGELTAIEPPGSRDGGAAPPAPLTCTVDADCNAPDRQCVEGKCVKGQAPTVGECEGDVDCELGAICVSAECVPGCYSTFDCPYEEVCNDVGQCEPELPASESECIIDSDCNPGDEGSGMICSSERTCIPGCHLDSQCPGASICLAGDCY